MNRLKKRRPSSPTRPSTNFSTTSGSSYESATSRTIRTRSGVDGLGDGYVEILRSSERLQKEKEEQEARKSVGKGLPQLNLAQNDFRGSVIIGSLSKRFSVLRFDESSPQSAPPPPLPHSSSMTSLQSRQPPNERSHRRDLSGDRHHAVVPLPTSARSMETSPIGSSSSFSPLSPTGRMPIGYSAGGGISHSSSTTSIASVASGSGALSPTLNTTGSAQLRGPGWPSVSLTEIKQRLAMQRQKGGLNHIREEEEERVLGELMGNIGGAASGGVGPGSVGGGSGIAWGAQGQGHGQIVRSPPIGAVGLPSVPSQDFRSSPTVWGQELQEQIQGQGRSGISRSITAPTLSNLGRNGPEAYSDPPRALSPEGTVATSSMYSTMSGGIATSQTLPNLISHSGSSLPRSTSASDVRSESGGRSFGFGSSGRMSDEKMAIMAMQKKGKKKEEARLDRLEEVGEIRFGYEDAQGKVAGSERVGQHVGNGVSDMAGSEDENDRDLASLPEVAPLKPRKRQSYIAGLSQRDVARISKALWEVEDEIFKQLVREIDGEEAAYAEEEAGTGGPALRKGSTDTIRQRQESVGAQDGPTISPGAEEGLSFKTATPPPKVKRVNSRRKPSITRSPAFHENLAAVVEAELVLETEKFDPGDLVNKGPAERPGKEPHVEFGNMRDVFSSHSPDVGPVRTAETAPAIRPLRTSASGENLPSPVAWEHVRSASSSAVPISKVAVERGYSPGQSRPYTPDRATFGMDSAPNTPSPHEQLEDENLTPPARLNPLILPRITGVMHKRNASAGLSIQPPAQRAGSLLSSYSSNGLPSVSPVVESFEESSEIVDRGQNAGGRQEDFLHGHSALEAQGFDPYDVSFDAAGYYGSSSPVADAHHFGHRLSSATLASSFRDSRSYTDLDDLFRPERVNPDAETDPWARSDDLASYEEMCAAQERLVAAARSVREAMRGSTLTSPPTSSGPSLRARPSVRARKLETTIYDDQYGVSQMVRAMSPRSPAPMPESTPKSDKRSSPSSALATIPFTPAPSQPRALPDQVMATSSSRTASPSVMIPVMQTSAPPVPSQVTDAPPDAGAKARLALALFGSEEPATRSGHQRTESATSTGSFRLDENPDVIKDFEERIARANASLQRNNSMAQRSTHKGTPRVIGTPTLVDTSSVMKVTPLMSPDQMRAKRKPSVSRSLTASPSLDAMDPSNRGIEQDGGGKGLRGLISKLKRKDSKVKATSPSVTASPSFSEVDTPTMGSSLRRKASVAAVSHALQKAPSLSRRNKVGLGIEGFDMITPQEASLIAPRQTRNDVVRRTIIIANPEHLLVGGGTAQQRSRKISTRRKPVQYSSDDAGEENLKSPVLADSGNEPTRGERLSSSSLLDYYAGLDDSSSSVDRSTSRDSTGSRAIEIREMSDGALVWGVVDGREADAADFGPKLRKASATTVDSAYSDDYREIIGSSTPAGMQRPQTQVFYSAPDKVADLVNELSESGHQGNFRIIPTTQEPVQDRLHNLIARLKATPKEGGV